MEVLDVLNLGEIAQYFSKMAMFPVFDLAYYIVSILYLKYEPGAVEVSRKSPVASWLCAMLYCFGSYILADIMLGVSPIDYFHNNSHILLASAVWYLIFFCPLNLFYKCVAFLPVKLVLVALKEVVRSRKIAAGVHHAHHAYHHGWLIMIITGYVKGSGVALMANFEQLLRGVWKPETNEILNMSFPTKASLYGAILFTLQEAHVLPASKSTLICLFTLFMATSKVVMTARHSHGSPFALVEHWVCHLLFGSPLGEEESHDHHHSAPAAASASLSPAKTKEDLSEGTRKRKSKKAE
ncbi:trimeric intracellular cation channel type A [Triplophysa rosa]|uniref:Trimeric intracellular cation channel type A n=1 Tax=Triplophysa rosa TaxID=992332 RepID=A0A9W7TEM5_TRIRA|nr:trimeric intracellular cation channel type A [Triplophysa rosa]KAI7795539.1 trimeric intracellular cation channel type A [Triplophysa rosa]